MERFTAKINLDQQISKYVKAGLSFNISRNNYDNVPLGNGENENSGIITAAVAFNPTVPVRDEKEIIRPILRCLNSRTRCLSSKLMIKL